MLCSPRSRLCSMIMQLPCSAIRNKYYGYFSIQYKPAYKNVVIKNMILYHIKIPLSMKFEIGLQEILICNIQRPVQYFKYLCIKLPFESFSLDYMNFLILQQTSVLKPHELNCHELTINNRLEV